MSEPENTHEPRDPFKDPTCQTFRYANDAFMALNLMQEELSRADDDLDELEDRADRLMGDVAELFDDLSKARGLSEHEHEKVWMGNYREVFADGEGTGN